MSLERTCSEAAQAEAALEAARHQQAAECTAQAVLAAAYSSACRRRDALLLQWEEGLLRLQEKGEQHAACLQVGNYADNQLNAFGYPTLD